MLNQLWAKVSAREKLVVYGAVIAAVGVLVGMILGTKSYGGGSIGGVSIPGVSVNYFTAENAGLFALLTLIAAIATLVIVYLHAAPNMSITWPMPYAQILLGAAGITAACAILVILMQLIRTGGLGTDPPIFEYVADILIVAGGALAAYAAYMEWNSSKVA